MRLDGEKHSNAVICALKGIVNSIKTERNVKIDLFFAIVVIIMGIVFKISLSEWIVCTILIGLVISAEIMNTAVEAVVDLVTRERNPLAGKAKDAAAGAVLVLAIVSAIIGAMIFIPKIINLF